MTNRIDRTFVQLRKRRQKALIGYITAGFPTRGDLPQLVRLLEKAGTDILEIGVPFSDPIADGPTIQHASQVALQQGATLGWVLTSVKRLRQNGIKIPLILMTYCNPVYSMGIERFFKAASAAGVDGTIFPDLIPEEADDYAHAARKYGLDLIYLAAPTTPKERIRMIAAQTHGFLYAVSLTGVTGTRRVLPIELPRFLKSIRAVCRKPIAVGFGISTPALARAAARHADGIIVGSALIREIEKSHNNGFGDAVRFVRHLKGALHAS